MPGYPKYNLLKDYNEKTDIYSSQDPYWVVLVVGLSNPVTYSRSSFGSVGATGEDDNSGVGVRNKLVISSDCLSLNVSGSKAGYTKTLNAVLKNADTNYLTEILPGDWVMAWMVNNKDSFDSLKERLSQKTTTNNCNLFNDGLKFLGRAHDIRVHVEVDPMSGKKMSNTTLSAVGFNELSTQFFYNPYLAALVDSEKELQNWYAKVGVGPEIVERILSAGKNNGNVIIPFLMDLIIGKGVGNRDINRPQISIGLSGPAAGGGASGEAPFAYIVPQEVGNILGKSSGEASKKSGILSYADLIELWIGIQEYKPESLVPSNINTSKSSSSRKILDKGVLGTFFNPPTFVNTALWTQLQQYVNPEINEMYTCLKANETGLIVPQVVVRQIPFTTEAFRSRPNHPALSVTRFLSLPRWELPPVLIKSMSLGRSDSTRTNFVHVYASCYMQDADTIPEQMARNFPIRDDMDIQRNGFRGHMKTVDAHIVETKDQSPDAWMTLVADWSIGSHLTLNGTIACFGIQSPISEGDNVQFEKLVLHIESINHSCGISADGQKFFNTTMNVSNGMEDVITGKRVLFPSYPGLFQTTEAANNSEEATREAEESGVTTAGGFGEVGSGDLTVSTTKIEE